MVFENYLIIVGKLYGQLLLTFFVSFAFFLLDFFDAVVADLEFPLLEGSTGVAVVGNGGMSSLMLSRR